jgi:GNAT superfamily N-acetyltransferase
MTGFNKKEFERLLELAANDPNLGPFVKQKKLEDTVLFEEHGEVVGFAIPRKDPDGYWRTGPIYVQPKSRGKGVASRFIQSFFSDKKGRSWIDPKNTASIHAFKLTGFNRTGKVVKDGSGILEEYTYIPAVELNLIGDMKRLFDAAMRDPFLGPAALTSHLENIQPIVYKGHTVGFVVPFREDDGYWRTGSIYIEPAFRKKGIAHDWIETFMEGKAGRAWIDPRNKSSIAAYTAAGFTRSGRRVKSNISGNWFDEYLTEEAGMESKLPTTLLAW